MKSYQQKADHTCGAACVRTILACFGLRVPSERWLARELLADCQRGIEPFRIEQYLIRAGLAADYRVEKTFPSLRRRWLLGWLPIVCWSDWGGHYCIVGEIADRHGWSGGYMRLIDPAASYEDRPAGCTEVSVDRFKSMWYTPGEHKRREVIYVKGGE